MPKTIKKSKVEPIPHTTWPWSQERWTNRATGILRVISETNSMTLQRLDEQLRQENFVQKSLAKGRSVPFGDLNETLAKPAGPPPHFNKRQISDNSENDRNGQGSNRKEPMFHAFLNEPVRKKECLKVLHMLADVFYSFEIFDALVNHDRLSVGDYSVEFVKRTLLSQVSTDLSILLQALNQPRIMNPNLQIKRAAAGENGEARMTHQWSHEGYMLHLVDAIAEYTMGLIIDKGMIPHDTTILSYTQADLNIRVVPYSNAMFLGIPYSVVNRTNDWLSPDLMAIPHEIGHYLFHHGKRPGTYKRAEPSAQLESAVTEQIGNDIDWQLLTAPVKAADLDDYRETVENLLNAMMNREGAFGADMFKRDGSLAELVSKNFGSSIELAGSTDYSESDVAAVVGPLRSVGEAFESFLDSNAQIPVATSDSIEGMLLDGLLANMADSAERDVLADWLHHDHHDMDRLPTEIWYVRWLEELFSDAFCCFVAGPASVLTFQEMLSNRLPDELRHPSAKHPIRELRPKLQSLILSTCSDYLEELNQFTPQLRLLDENWERWIEEHRLSDDDERDLLKKKYRLQGYDVAKQQPVEIERTGQEVIEKLGPLIQEIVAVLVTIIDTDKIGRWSLMDEGDELSLAEMSRHLTTGRFLKSIQHNEMRETLANFKAAINLQDDEKHMSFVQIGTTRGLQILRFIDQESDRLDLDGWANAMLFDGWSTEGPKTNIGG